MDVRGERQTFLELGHFVVPEQFRCVHGAAIEEPKAPAVVRAHGCQPVAKLTKRVGKVAYERAHRDDTLLEANFDNVVVAEWSARVARADACPQRVQCLALFHSRFGLARLKQEAQRGGGRRV
eukprot:scaffold11381_cov68-Phaeocystis_antarctica.AAC.6